MERLSVAESLRRRDKRRRRGWTVVVGHEVRWVRCKSATFHPVWDLFLIRIGELLSRERNGHFRAWPWPSSRLYCGLLEIIAFAPAILTRPSCFQLPLCVSACTLAQTHLSRQLVDSSSSFVSFNLSPCNVESWFCGLFSWKINR